MTLDNGPPGRKRAPTILDVAAEADVAIGTVSRYINGLPIRSANRGRVEQAISKLGYRRNATAVAMKTDVTHIVGFMGPRLTEFHAGMLDHLSRKMRASGRAVLSFGHELQPKSMREGLELFVSHRVDAVVMDGEEALTQELLKFIDDGLLVVLYENDVEGLPVDRVFVDNQGACRRIVRHLLELGHERIGVLHGSLRNATGRERLAGFNDALAEYGLVADPELYFDGNWREAGGYAGMRHFMSLPNPPTAVFSSNYIMSIGALTYLQEAALTIPQDLSFVSFDDVPALRLHNPPITTVEQPIEKIAEAITDIVHSRLTNSNGGRQMIKIDCDIKLRGSVRRIR